MRKILIVIAAMAIALLALAGPASATGVKYEGKKQTICHFTSENASHQYNRIEVDVNSILKENGHAQHDNGADIIPAFAYYEKVAGEWVPKTFPGQGDLSLLAFEDCVKPKDDEKVAKPSPVAVDPCVTKNDSFSVAPGEGYTVGNVVKNGLIWTITVTLNDGFAWADGTKTPLVFTHTFTNIDCDLPDTGIGATFNTAAGYGALAGALLVGGMLTRRRRIN